MAAGGALQVPQQDTQTESGLQWPKIVANNTPERHLIQLALDFRAFP
jgi:hypothetical protein